MCLILCAWRCHPEYPLVLAANRDEYYRRPTKKAHWWPEHPELLAGRDMEARGTWLGMTRGGRIAALTNVREPQLSVPTSQSRGQLPCCYLENGSDNQGFAGLLLETRDDYRGYNLIYGSLGEELFYYSNRVLAPRLLEPGLYGLSNARLDTPWPKVQRGKAGLRQLLADPRLTTDHLLSLLDDQQIFADELLPATGVSLSLERQLSPLRISGADYGTRSSTAILVDRQGRVLFHERQLAPDPRSDAQFSFSIPLR
jgi:uncharacterized protein with NRDE domain